MRKSGIVWSGIVVAAALACVVILILEMRSVDPRAETEFSKVHSNAIARTAGASAGSIAKAKGDAETSDDVDPREAEYEAKQREWWGRIVKVLSERDDADSVVAAAFLSRMADPISAATARTRETLLAQFARAAALAPNDPAIQSLALEVCYGASDCDPSQYENTLRSIDPKNALALIGAVSRAEKDKDNGALSSALADMSKAERMDLYWAATIENVIHAVESVPIPPPDVPEPQHPATLHFQVAITAIGIAAAFALPPMSSLTKACKSSPSFAADCNRIGMAMERGDTFFSRGVGLSIEKSVVAQGSADAARVAEARRQLDWLMRGQSMIATSNADPALWLQLLDEKRNEIDATKAWMVQNGIPAEPPPGWTRENQD